MQFTTCNIYVVNKFLIACPFVLRQCIAASRTSLGPNLGKWGIVYAIWSSNLLAGKVEFNSTVDLLQATWQAWPLLRWYWSSVSYLCWCFSRANCRMDTEILYCTQGFVVLRLWVSEGCLWRKWKFCDDPVCSDVYSQWVMVNLHLFLGVAVMHCFSSALLFLWGLGAWCQVLADLACLQRKAFFWEWSSSYWMWSFLSWINFSVHYLVRRDDICSLVCASWYKVFAWCCSHGASHTSSISVSHQASQRLSCSMSIPSMLA